MAAYQNWKVEILFSAWTDVTAYVETINGPFTIVSGATPETVENGTLTITFNNADQRFTPLNVNSPYYPYVKSARKIRVTETIGNETFYLFTGYLEWPEIGSWTASTSSSPRDQTISITAVDLIGWLEHGQEFISNLGAHILGTLQPDSSALKAFWPLTDPGPKAYSAGPTSQPALVPELYLQGPRSQDLTTALLWQQDGPGGDDATLPQFALTESSTYVTGAQFQTVSLVAAPLLVGVGEVLTISAWIKLGRAPANALTKQSTICYLSSSVFDSYVSVALAETASGELRVDITASLTDETTNVLEVDWYAEDLRVPVDQWTLLSVQVPISLAANAQILYIGDDTYTTTATGALPVEVGLDTMELVGAGCSGGLGYLQFYETASADQFDHAGQYEVGISGLGGQYTGDRVRSILRYAGVAPIDLGRIDDGESIMQRASLAGKNPVSALQEAVDTEQGDLYADGSGLPVFADRRTLYNV
jgi:hypothetical protein